MTGPAAAKPVPVWLIWGVLALASGAGFALVEGLAPAQVAAMLAILLAAAKIHLIITHYMDLNWTHQPLRGLLTAWLGVVTLILLVGAWSA